MVRAFVLEAGRLGSILIRVKPKTLKLVSAVTFAKRSAIDSSRTRGNLAKAWEFGSELVLIDLI